MAEPAPGWRLAVASALLYTLAFNLTFFIQELFLVWPKALTPGLTPTLFHNNHRWEGEHPLARLFQGTGALAILVSGLVCAVLWRRSRSASPTQRLFLFWMAYSGLFMALPQVAIGAISAQSDVGMAMGYLGLSDAPKATLGVAALVAIPPLAFLLTPPLFRLAPRDAELAAARDRSRFLFRAVTLPALAALPLIILFRIPREWIEVAAVPAVVSLVGIPWIQAAALRRPADAVANRAPPVASITGPLVAVVLLLLTFQLVLRPGIRFHG